MNLEKHIGAFISEVPQGCIFDAHAVITYLLENYPNDYLGFHSPGECVNTFHGRLSQMIDKFANDNAIERVDAKTYSKNITGKFSENVCWKKNRVSILNN